MKCKNCSEHFSWKAVMKSLFFGYKPLTCESCGSVHYVSFWTRILNSALITLFPLILVFSRFVPLKPPSALVAYFIWVAFTVLISPFFARYELRQNQG